jgi:hypothetical protein
MNINVLAKKAAKGPAPAAYGGAMEVEDMIHFVLFHGAEAALEIERLSAQHQWVMDGLLSDGSRVVPFGRWAQVCVAFGRGGVPALIPFLSDVLMADFAVAILSDVRTSESVQALANYCDTANFKADHYSHPEWVEWKAVFALNELLGLDHFVVVEKPIQEQVQKMLFRAYECAANPFLQGQVLAVMRGVPTVTTLLWMENLALTDSDLMRIRKQCVKKIKLRLDPNFKPLTAEEKRQLHRRRAADV